MSLRDPMEDIRSKLAMIDGDIADVMARLQAMESNARAFRYFICVAMGLAAWYWRHP